MVSYRLIVDGGLACLWVMSAYGYGAATMRWMRIGNATPQLSKGASSGTEALSPAYREANNPIRPVEAISDVAREGCGVPAHCTLPLPPHWGWAAWVWRFFSLD